MAEKKSLRDQLKILRDAWKNRKKSREEFFKLNINPQSTNKKKKK